MSAVKNVDQLIPPDATKRILVSAEEAAHMLGLSTSGFVRLGLPRVRFGRRAVRYRWDDISALIQKRIILSRGAKQ
jgi:predicted DNA-binding transcriptional regulator AlpA